MKFPSKQSGFGMVEMLVGTTLISMVAILGLKQMQKTDSMRAKFEDRYKLDALGYDIQRDVDCSKVPKSCSSGTTISLYGRDGSVLIAADKSSRKKGWNFAAQCVGQNRFEVRVAKFDANHKFFPDPVTKQNLDWNHPQAVIFPEGTLCSISPTKAAETDDNITVMAGDGCLVSSPKDLPCTPPQPPVCSGGYVSTGITIDTFGGADGLRSQGLYGQRWLRYCAKIK